MIAEKVKKDLIESIELGHYPSGAKFPTRHELMDKYHVARMTIDKVVKELIADGVLSSHKGSGTFVRGIPKSGQRHIYFITPGSTEPTVFSFSNWLKSLHHHSNPPKFSLISNHQIERNVLEITKEDARLIWNTPDLECYAQINAFERMKVPQIVINRPLPDLNYAATDTLTGLNKMLDYIQTLEKKPEIGMLATPPSPNLPYLPERESFFHESLMRHGWTLKRLVRAKSFRSHDLATAVHEFFEDKKLPRYIFTPYIHYFSYMIMLANERGIKMGQDLVMLTTDPLRDTEGVITMQQDMAGMFKTAADWSLLKDNQKFQKLIPPKLFIHDHLGERTQ